AWNSRGSVELGETRTRTFHWLSTLRAAGAIDRTVTADSALYSVFVRETGERTYVVYQPAGKGARNVRFSDGTALRAEPGRLTHVVRASQSSPGRSAAQAVGPGSSGGERQQ
ncbi:MAG: hypothetical protein ACKO8O_13215, partial [Betaproteobacteria bacterium]